MRILYPLHRQTDNTPKARSDSQGGYKDSGYIVNIFHRENARRTWEFDAESDDRQAALDDQSQADKGDDTPDIIGVLDTQRARRVRLALGKQLDVKIILRGTRKTHAGD